MNTNTYSNAAEPDPSLVTLTHVTYALHALGLAIGAFGASTVIGAFVFGWPSIIAVIINYVKQGDARGTWLESHFRWQMRTVWIALGWVVLLTIAALIRGPADYMLIWRGGVYALGVWATYRLVRGVHKLRRRESLPG